MAPVVTCLWFENQAEEAARFYVSLLPNSSIDRLHPLAADTPSMKKGETIFVDFTLDGAPYRAMNGGGDFPLTPAVSIFRTCADQAEVDQLWEALLEGGAPMACGWLTDRFGVSWQIVPDGLLDLFADEDRMRAERAMQAMMTQVKLDIGLIRAAADQTG